MSKDGWKFLGIGALGVLVGYGVAKLVESQQYKTLKVGIRRIAGQVDSIEGRVNGIEGKLLAQGERMGEVQMELRFFRVQLPEVNQRVSRIEGYLTPPPPNP